MGTEIPHTLEVMRQTGKMRSISWVKEWGEARWDCRGKEARADIQKLEVCPAIYISHKKLFQIITLPMSKAPNLNSSRQLRGRGKAEDSLEPTGSQFPLK